MVQGCSEKAGLEVGVMHEPFGTEDFSMEAGPRFNAVKIHKCIFLPVSMSQRQGCCALEGVGMNAAQVLH